jgi:hypothetical protein
LWEELLEQVGLIRMDQPGVNGEWSMKDIVAHLTGWNRWLITRLQAAQHGESEPLPPWPAQLQSDDEINAWIFASKHERSVREVLDESRRPFQQLLAVMEDHRDHARAVCDSARLEPGSEPGRTSVSEHFSPRPPGTQTFGQLGKKLSHFEEEIV